MSDTDNEPEDEIIKGKGRHNVKIISGFVESMYLDSKGKWRRSGKRISYGPPCECFDCARGLND